jgi:hypothetical protein
MGKEKILIRLPGLTVKGQKAVYEYRLAGIVFGLVAHDNANDLGVIFLESIHDGLVYPSFHMPGWISSTSPSTIPASDDASI